MTDRIKDATKEAVTACREVINNDPSWSGEWRDTFDVVFEAALQSAAVPRAVIDINHISIGDKIQYRDGAIGEVFSIVEKVIDAVNHRSEENVLHSARIFSRLENGGGCYYTHRKDGICTHEAGGDIVAILGEAAG